MPLTRRQFCEGIGSGSLLLLTSCGGSDGYSPAPAPMPAPTPTPAPPPPPASVCGATAITGNHGHDLTIAAADLDSPVDKTFSIAGAADHDHTITLSVAQLQSIKAKTGAVTVSSITAGHSHDVTVNCT